MDDLEQRLQRARRAEPSADLDRRIEAVFRSVRPNAPAVAVLSARYWWLGAVAAGLSLAAGLLVSTRREPPAAAPVPVVYHIEAEGRLRDLLVNAADVDVLPRYAAPVPAP